MRKLYVVLVAALLALLAACSGESVGESQGQEEPAQKTPSASTSGSGEGDGGGAIELTDDVGTVTIPSPAQKVVALEWAEIEHLQSIGVTPVGAALSEGYTDWVTAVPALPDSVVDVGSRSEPSLEKIRILKPDLIVTEVDTSAANMAELKKIAPVLAFRYTTKPQLDHIAESVRTLGKATGNEEAAEATIAAMNAKIDSVKQQLAAAGQEGTTFGLAQGFTADGAPTMRMFGTESMTGQLLERVGLTNAWDGKLDEWGFTTVGVEALTSISDADRFLYIAQPDDNIFEGLADNAVWKQLGFVQDEHVEALDPGTWTFGGTMSAMQLLDQIAKIAG